MQPHWKGNCWFCGVTTPAKPPCSRASPTGRGRDPDALHGAHRSLPSAGITFRQETSSRAPHTAPRKLRAPGWQHPCSIPGSLLQQGILPGTSTPCTISGKRGTVLLAVPTGWLRVTAPNLAALRAPTSPEPHNPRITEAGKSFQGHRVQAVPDAHLVPSPEL